MDQAAAGPDINTLGENVAGQADASNAANLNFGRPGRESALETYKKKDAQKGTSQFHLHNITVWNIVNTRTCAVFQSAFDSRPSGTRR